MTHTQWNTAFGVAEDSPGLFSIYTGNFQGPPEIEGVDLASLHNLYNILGSILIKQAVREGGDLAK